MNEKYLNFAKELAYEAGTIMRRYFKAEDIGTDWKQDKTPVTVADTKINSLVIKKVKSTFPKHGVIGEEESHETQRDMLWVVDPIDGTVPFSLAIPTSTFSLALVDKNDGQPVVAVAYDPYLDHLYWAVRGVGSYLNENKITVSKTTKLDKTYFAAHGGTKPEDAVHFKPGRCIDILRDQGSKYFSFQSAVYATTRVASGELIGTIFGYGSPWDSAAVALIVEEAGGLATDLLGNKRRYDEWGLGLVTAANKTILNKMLAAIKKACV